ncbi:methyltransferase family protein [Halomicrobium urmianum]|uniref:methyltransferase family protein n=1 Tax=Halomicrobium urmianum TaxID=1586233 RepID=UPI001CDA1810|nr:methyltransferase [Halomicrobium urmianum]
MGAEGAVIAALIVSIVRPSHRIWPPGDISWTFWYYWGNVAITAVALATVGYADAGNFVFTGRLWTWIGGLLIVTGAAFAGWAGRTLQIHTTVGLEGELQTDGPYQYTRNPQLVGLSAVLVGVLFAVNSSYLVVGTLPVFAWIVVGAGTIPLLKERDGTAVPYIWTKQYYQNPSESN